MHFRREEQEMDQHLNRRRFLGAAIGTGAAAAAAGSWAPTAGAQGGSAGARRGVPNNRIGIQLYSLRRLMPNGDRRAVRSMFNWLGRAGYTEVEMAGHYEFDPALLRRWIDEAGLRAPSGHDGFDLAEGDAWKSGYEQTLENAVALGQKYTGLAWFEGPYTTEYFKFLAERMNEAGTLAKAAGLQFFYHNHDFEFINKQPDGTPNYNILLDETDPELVKFELDLYWIVKGGENPLAYLSTDPGRWPLYHVKDKTWKDRPDILNPDGTIKDVVQEFEDVGPGAIDFPDIFAAGHARRVDKHFIIEHDWPQLSHPGDPNAEYTTAQTGLDYLRNVRF
jgi:sugar phosphate isomerase/epimerase